MRIFGVGREAIVLFEELGASESAGCQPARRFSTCPTKEVEML
jgi:hypothetical protein